MTVEDWSKREAIKVWPLFSKETDAAVLMSNRLADRLLSDEAVEAAARALYVAQGAGKPWSSWDRVSEDDRAVWRDEARAALRAAIDAVTREEGGNE